MTTVIEMCIITNSELTTEKRSRELNSTLLKTSVSLTTTLLIEFEVY